MTMVQMEEYAAMENDRRAQQGQSLIGVQPLVVTLIAGNPTVTLNAKTKFVRFLCDTTLTLGFAGKATVGGQVVGLAQGATIFAVPNGVTQITLTL